MLHRQKPPNKGLWNGVGGRVEPGESGRDCVLREVQEETGYKLANVSFAGVLTWDGFETPPGGLYLFMAEAPDGEPQACVEGPLAWKPRDWVFSSPEVVSNIHVFGPQIFSWTPPQTYHFVYLDGQIVYHETRPLSEGLNVG